MKLSWRNAAIATWFLIVVILVGAWLVSSSSKVLLSVVHHSPRLPNWARSCMLFRLFETSRYDADDDLKLYVYEHNLIEALHHESEIENRLNEMAPVTPSRKLLVLRAVCRLVADDKEKARALLTEAKAIPMGDQDLAVLDRIGFGVTDVEIDAMIQKTEN